MDNLRLMIVDDVEDNRLVLHAICRKMEGFEIQEAGDGFEAIALCEAWRPHIILMDVMMPNLDGFEASKIIKSRFPETIIIVITAVMDSRMEENMASIGVAAYIHKPIDKELIRFKLQSFGAFLRSKEGEYRALSTKESLNPFSSDIRHFKTIFTVNDAEGMMDFGVWILSRCEGCRSACASKIDPMIELFYDLMRQGIREEGQSSIIVEESFEEMFITMKLDHAIVLSPKTQALAMDLQSRCIIRHNIACVRLSLADIAVSLPKETLETSEPAPLPEQSVKPMVVEVIESPVVSIPPHNEPSKEVRVLPTNEQQLLRQSFVRKTPAVDYVSEIGGDVLDEIRDLESLDEDWIERLRRLEADPSVENIRLFADGVLGVYVRAINNLFEFTALAYALSSLGTFMKEHADVIIDDPKKLKTLVMLTEHLGSDLTSWREHIFALQDAADIHYLDSSFFSSCMQIEQIVGDKQIDSDDDNDNDIEFF
jgi:CheY-like chemotaxis protein